VHRFFDSLPAVRRFDGAIAVTCVPGDEHELGAEILSRYLTIKGWNVYYIGRSSPEGEILREIKRGGYDTVLLSVSMIRHLPSFERLVSRLRMKFPDLTIIAGGGALSAAETVMRDIAGMTARTPTEAHELLAQAGEKDA
jgi:methanogenic corrinoid protein MtbC1